jgi:integrase
MNNNDIELNRRKIKRYFPSNESVNNDRIYSKEEIQQILSVCDLRTKAMILLMASSGVRIGSLSSMEIGHLVPVNYQCLDLYKVRVYAGTRYEYYSLCTPECRTALQEMLAYRKRCHEELKDKSPLFRKHFNKEDPFTINVPKFLTDSSVMRAIDGALKRSGVKTSEARRSHAWRKGFKSISEID